MVGRYKRQRLNLKKTNVARAVKKTKSIITKKKKESDSMEIDSATVAKAVEQHQQQNAPATTDENKKQPIVNENKVLRGSKMPMKVTSRPKKPNNLTNVVHSRKLSKKLAKKIMKEERRNNKQKVELENQMQE